VLGLGGAASYWTYKTQKQELQDEASDRLRDATAAFVQAIGGIFEPALAISETLRKSGIQNTDGLERKHLFFAIATGVVSRYRQIGGIYIGFPDGRFLQVQDLPLKGEASGSGTEVGRLISRIIDNPAQDRIGKWGVYDPSAETWRPFVGQRKNYDPRLRPWYRAAIESGGPVWTDAYVYATSGKLGITYAEPFYKKSGEFWGILGVDLTLAALSQRILATSDALSEIAEHVFATDLGKRVIGHRDFVAKRAELDSDTTAFLARYHRKNSFENTLSRQFPIGNSVRVVEVGKKKYLASKADLNRENTMPLQIYLAKDLDEVLAGATATVQRNVALVFMAFVVLAIVAAYAVKLRVEVTARQRAEAELIEARDIAEAATQAKSTFLATMSHEIRTPMNGIMSITELFSNTKLTGEQRRMAKIISDSATALLTIINDILDFSKIEAGALEIEAVDLSLADTVNSAAELLVSNAEGKGLELIVEIDPELPDARRGDPTRIRQILLNLGSNAIKFTEKGSVRFSVEPLPEDGADWLRFAVADTGIGLTQDQRERLFQAFVQADSSTSRKYGGTGLGLSICQRLCELMGGRIGVDSRPGEGSVFWFEIPLAVKNDARPSPEQDIAAAAVFTVGLSDAAAAVTERYLRAAGIGAIGHGGDLAAAAREQAALWIVDCDAPGLDADALGHLQGTIALSGARAKIAALPEDIKAKATAILPTPFSMTGLWHTVAVALGLADAADDAFEMRPDLAFAPPDIEEARAAGALVLVAEDNATNQFVIRELLAKLGYACEIGNNGKEALAMLETPGYGILLTDFHMPEMDGFALTRAIRNSEKNNGGKRLPIVALTADALAGTSGKFDGEAIELISTSPDAWLTQIAEINAALSKPDMDKARDVVHALKGSALSIGANRLGRIAATMQDLLDAGDIDTTLIMADNLQPTLTEFRETLPKILRYGQET
jgi:signal transduction histidine kinase/CheY-like chemotaxis protein